MKRVLLLGPVLCFLTPNVLLAQEAMPMSYSAFEVSWIDVEIDSGLGSIDGDGFAIAGSYELSDQIFLFGEYQDQSLDFGIDGEQWELGGGWHKDVSATIDFVATLSFIDAQVESGSASADDDGLGLGGGIRARVSDDIQIDAAVKFVDFDESGSDTGFTVGGRYYINDTMAITAAADFYDNADTLSMGFRVEF